MSFAEKWDWASNHKPTALGVSTTASVVVGGLAFSLSFTALTELASQNGVSEGQAWMLPLVVDGLVVVATAASSKIKGWRSIYPWMLLIIGTAISVWGNVVHAETNGFGAIGMLIAAIPPMVLLAVSHLTILLSRQAGADKAGEESLIAEDVDPEPISEEPAFEVVDKPKKVKKKKVKKAKKVAPVEEPTTEPIQTVYITPLNAPVIIDHEELNPVG